LDYLNLNKELSSDFYKNKIDLDIAKRSFVQLNIHYKSLTYESSTETPQTNVLYMLIGVGSDLGLFLGVSLFSIFEPIQVLIEILFLKYAKSTNRVNA